MLKSLFWIIVLSSILFTITGLFCKEVWFLDLASHFPLQYLILQIVAFFITINIRHQSPLILQLMLLIAISINLMKVTDYYVAVNPDRVSQGVMHHLNML